MARGSAENDGWTLYASVYLPLMWTSASLSIAGELSLIAYYALVPGDRSFFLKLVTYMSLFMLGGSAAWFTNVPDPSVPLCVSGAVLSTFFYVSTFFWSCCIGLAMLQEVRRNEARGRVYELGYLAVCTLVPAVCVAVPIGLGLYSETVIEHEVGCWFTASWARIVFFDGWIFFSWCTNVLLLVLLRREFRKLANYSKLTPRFSGISEDRRRIFVSIVVSFILCWFWSLVLAVLALVRDFADVTMDPETTFPLAIIFAFFAPLQGFLNFVAFMALSRTFRHNYVDLWRRLLCMASHHQASYPHTSTDAFLSAYTPFVGEDGADDDLSVPATPAQAPAQAPASRPVPAPRPMPSTRRYESLLTTAPLSTSFEASINGDGGIVPSAMLPRVTRTASTASSVRR